MYGTSDPCVRQLKLEIPVSTYGHFSSCLCHWELQYPVSAYGTFRHGTFGPLAQHSFRPLSPSTEPFRPLSHIPSGPCLCLRNLQRPLSQHFFRPLSLSTESSDPCLAFLQAFVSVCGTFKDPYLSLWNLQTPVSIYGNFRPLSHIPSGPCLCLRNLQRPLSQHFFRPLSQSTGPFRPLSQPI